jgi:hypothetical protein
MIKCPLRGAARVVVAWCALVALMLSGGPGLVASDLLPTKDFADVAAAVHRYIDEYHGDRPRRWLL